MVAGPSRSGRPSSTALRSAKASWPSRSARVSSRPPSTRSRPCSAARRGQVLHYDNAARQCRTVRPDPMIRVTRSAVIDAPIERVWAVLRDFNSHTAWHPVVAESEIEGGEPSDQIGCVRRFTLRDGNHIREQLLALSDRDHVSTYCILDASVPLRRYVATLQLKRVTDGERTFWHWQSTFDAPPGRERELTDMVGTGVYEGGFEGLRTFLRRPGHAPARDAAGRRRPPSGEAMPAQGVVVSAFGGPEVLRHQSLPARPPGPGQVRIRQTAVGVNYIDVYVRAGLYRMIEPPAVLGMEAAGVVEDVGDGIAHLLPGDRVAYACAPPGAYVGARTMPADQVVVLPDDVDEETAAALMLKGMTAAYLLHRTHRVRAGETVLVHAAAGGVGLFLCQWARALGARAIGPEVLGSKSTTLSRPVLFHYTAERAALNEIAQQTFEALRAGTIRVQTRHRYPLAAAAEAHRDLEGRRTTGPLVLLP